MNAPIASSGTENPDRIDGHPTPSSPSGNPSAMKAMNARVMSSSFWFRNDFVITFNSGSLLVSVIFKTIGLNCTSKLKSP